MNSRLALLALGFGSACAPLFSPDPTEVEASRAPAALGSVAVPPRPTPTTTTAGEPTPEARAEAALEGGPPSEPTRPDEPARYVVWLELDDVKTSHFVREESNGPSEEHRLPGLWIERDGRPTNVRLIRTKLHLPSCQELLLGEAGGEPGQGYEDELELASAEARWTLPRPSLVAHAAELAIEELSLVGPYLLAQTHEWVDGCGAFPTESRGSRAWDLRTLDPVDLELSTRERSELIAEARALVARDCDDQVHLSVSGFRPYPFGPRLLGEHIVSLSPACDAWPEWTEESSLLTLRTPTLPPPLRPHADLPPAVRDLLSAHPDSTPRGFARLEPRAP